MLAIVIIAFVLLQLIDVGGGNWGSFAGKPVASWSDDGRNMTLETDFAYVDPRGKKWSAPKGAVINGASIPRPFWSVIGGPFEGRFRNASVVHDVYCDSMSEPSQAVHFMFYEACRCGGVSEQKAKMLYYAVATFGPKWEFLMQSTDGGTEPVTHILQSTRSITDEDLARIQEYFETNNPNVEDIPRLQIH